MEIILCILIGIFFGVVIGTFTASIPKIGNQLERIADIMENNDNE